MRRRDIQDKIDLYTEWEMDGELGSEEKLTLWLLKRVMKLTEGEEEEPETNLLRTTTNNPFLLTTNGTYFDAPATTHGRVRDAAADWGDYTAPLQGAPEAPPPTLPTTNRFTVHLSVAEYARNIDWYAQRNAAIDHVQVIGGATLYSVSYDA